MTTLRGELARVGIRGRLADRIVAELDDHLACDPGANLGDPALIAARFAEELSVPRTRRATHLAFVSLALLALLLLPGQSQGHALPGLVIVLASQVAFVAGVLAAWGVRRGTSTAVVRRRVVVALAAGAVAAGAAAVDAVLLRDWLELAVLAPLPLFATSFRDTRIVSSAGAAARGFSAAEAAGTGVVVAVAMTLGSTVAEHSWLEGLTRGAVESVAFAAGFLLLGRTLGIRR